MIANMMMYQRPQLEQAHNHYWQLIRKHLAMAGIDSPDSLSQNAEEFFVWTHPKLVLSQTCGMPYRLWLHEKVELVGTPNYQLPGCDAGYYRSAIIVRRDDNRSHINEFQNALFAYNQSFSQSGFAAAYQHTMQNGFWFERFVQTHQHRLSAMAVANGDADIASLDALSWQLMCVYEPFAQALRVLDWTEPTPTLPIITAKGQPVGTIYAAMDAAVNELSNTDRRLLSLKGLVKIPKEHYLAIPNPPEQADWPAISRKL